MRKRATGWLGFSTAASECGIHSSSFRELESSKFDASGSFLFVPLFLLIIRCWCDSAFRNSLGAIVSDSQCSSPCLGSYLSPLLPSPLLFSSPRRSTSNSPLLTSFLFAGATSTKCGGSYLNSVYTNSALLPSSATSTFSSSTASPSTVGSSTLPSGWSAVGCTQDGAARALTGSLVDLGSSATVESCLAVCRQGGFVLAGLQ